MNMPSEKLNSAIAAIKSGDKATSSRLLAEILIAEPSNETAWYWLATCVDDVEKKRYCLKRALSINPSNYTYIKALIKLELPPQPNLEDAQPPYLTQKISSENKLLSDEDESEISASLAKPVLPSVESSSPVKYTYKKHKNFIATLENILAVLLTALFFGIGLLFLLYLLFLLFTYPFI